MPETRGHMVSSTKRTNIAFANGIAPKVAVVNGKRQVRRRAGRGWRRRAYRVNRWMKGSSSVFCSSPKPGASLGRTLAFRISQSFE